MRLRIGLLIAIAMIALGISGCPAAMVGNLAYQGYKHEHESPTPTPTPLPGPGNTPQSNIE